MVACDGENVKRGSVIGWDGEILRIEYTGVHVKTLSVKCQRE